MDMDSDADDKKEEVNEEQKFIGIINFPQGTKGIEISYNHMKSLYNTFKQRIDGQTEITLDFNDSKISQNVANSVMRDWFEHEGQFIYAIRKLEVLKVKACSTQLTNLNFLSYFFDHYKLQKILLDCEGSLAENMLKIIKKCKVNIECDGFFRKNNGTYEIQCPYILIDSGAEIEENVVDLNIRVTEETYEQCIEALKKLVLVRQMNVEIHTLKNPKENFKEIMMTIKTHMTYLEELTLKIYQEQYFPHISKDDGFENLSKLTYKYELYDKDTEIKTILRQIQISQDNDDTIIIEPVCFYENKALQLNFKRRVLSEQELEELTMFFSKINHNLLSIEIKFDDDQLIPLKHWIGMINIFRTYFKLKTIIIKGYTIGPSISALCVAKLYKCKKTHIQINYSSFIDNKLTLYFYQLYDHILDVITENIFELQEIGEQSQIKSIQITAQSILGLTKGFSKFFNKTLLPYDFMRIQILNNYDIHRYYYKILKDRKEINKYCQNFSFEQQQNINFYSTAEEFNSTMEGIYSWQQGMIEMNIENSLSNELNRLFTKVTRYNSTSELKYEIMLELFKLYHQFRRLFSIFKYEKSQPPIMLAFYSILGPLLPINPYQVYTDLYFE